MRRTWLGIVSVAALGAALVWSESGLARARQAAPEQTQTTEPAQAAQAETADEPSPCQGLETGQLPGVLAAVPRYGSTFVLVVPERLAGTIPTASAPGVKELQTGVQSGTIAAEVARAIGIANIREYPPSEALQILGDVRDGKIDAAVMWAPEAGLGVVNLGLDGHVSLFTVDKPRAAPAVTAVEHPCAAAIADELDVSGVLPAELLVSVEIRDLLSERAPAFDLAQAREGGALFNQTCARCHGADAVADPHGLAPVDLRISIRRFSYPGFHYIVLNGRPSKSMPAFRGTVSDSQIPLIYQYLKARSNKVLAAEGAAAPSTP
jgi:mono/diheme cytochrome c family protein